MVLDVWWQLGLFATIARRARVGSRNLWRTVTATAKVTIAAIVSSVIAAIAFATIIASCERLGLLKVVGLVGLVCFLVLVAVSALLPVFSCSLRFSRVLLLCSDAPAYLLLGNESESAGTKHT